MSDSAPIIYWFRNDLRLADLPGLAAAVATGRPVIPCYILDDDSAGRWAPGGASRWWLHHSLASLEASIAGRGGELLIYRGDTRKILAYLATNTGAAGIYCSRAYEPWAAELERSLHDDFEAEDLEFKRFAGSLLFEPEQIANQSGDPFKVFTPFWKACLRESEPKAPKDAPGKGIFADWNCCPPAPTGPRAGNSSGGPARRAHARGWTLSWTRAWATTRRVVITRPWT